MSAFVASLADINWLCHWGAVMPATPSWSTPMGGWGSQVVQLSNFCSANLTCRLNTLQISQCLTIAYLSTPLSPSNSSLAPARSSQMAKCQSAASRKWVSNLTFSSWFYWFFWSYSLVGLTGGEGKDVKTSFLIPYDITCMWNLKYDINELIHKTETDSQA